jgi:hypothetical protein
MAAELIYSAPILLLIVMVAEVNSYIKMVVIPIRLVIPAPLASSVHPGNVVIDLAAVLTMPANIAVDSCAIRFKPAVTILFPILVCAGGTAES